MCGIAGILGFREGNASPLVCDRLPLFDIGDPNDSGVWRDTAAGLALGHARLSILDLSPERHQPMVSLRGRYVITYHEEVYNFAELRSLVGV